MYARCEKIDDITYQIAEIVQTAFYNIYDKDVYINIDYVDVSVGDYLINGKFYHELNDSTLLRCTEHTNYEKLCKSYIGIIHQQKREIESLKHDLALFDKYKDMKI